MTTTPNLGLKKPATSEPLDVAPLNDNSDTLDAFAGEVNESFAGKQDTLTFDAAPTEGSTNPVTSGGVFAALGAKAAVGDIYGSGTIITASSENPVDLNDITAVGRYQCGQSASAYVSHSPISQNLGFALTVATNGLASRYRQTLYLNSDTYAGVFYERYYTTNGWTVWYRFAGEAVT